MTGVTSSLPRAKIEKVTSALRGNGLNALAEGPSTSRVADLAIAIGKERLAVVRCVGRAMPEDHTALATMICEGDFVWAGLVYGEREGSEAVGFVETFHVSELDQLVSRLLELREVLGETG